MPTAKTRNAQRHRGPAGPRPRDRDGEAISSTARDLAPPYPDGFERILFGMGCFWGAERKFWQAGEGVYVTAVGYAGGVTPNPDL